MELVVVIVVIFGISLLVDEPGNKEACFSVDVIWACFGVYGCVRILLTIEGREPVETVVVTVVILGTDSLVVDLGNTPAGFSEGEVCFSTTILCGTDGGDFTDLAAF